MSMSTSTTAAQPSQPNVDTPSIATNTSPFDSPFDGDDTEDEWWDEETITMSNPPKATNATRITQWPSTRKPDRRYSVQKPTRDKSRGRQRKQNAKAGIKVVTNFSRHQPAAPPVQLQPSRTMPQMGCFVDLAALQALNGEADPPQDSSAFWKSKKNKELSKAAKTEPSLSTSGSNKGLTSTNALSSERRKTQFLIPSLRKSNIDLSPNDRPIVIGISIPSSDLADHTFSPQTATSEAPNRFRGYEHRMLTNQAPETPTIIITPAKEGTIWPTLGEMVSPADSHYQLTSSIYSQATHVNFKAGHCSDAPPVPEMPASFLEEERQRITAERSYFSPDSDDATTWGEEDIAERSATKSRVVSSGTLFEVEENDDSPIIVRTRRTDSVTAQTQPARNPSVSTVATQRRSKGWWNYITTPFLTRSNTLATRAFENEQPPALPSLAIAAAKAEAAERDGKLWEKQFSPLTPEASTTTVSDHWWNVDAKQPKSAEQSPVLQDSRHKAQTSTGTLPIVLSEVADLEMATPPSLASEQPSQLRRDNTSTTIHSTSGLSLTDREIPILSPALNTRGFQTNNPFVQPQLVDLENSSNQPALRRAPAIRSAEVSAPAAPAAPSQRIHSPSAGPPPPYSPSPARVKYRAVFPPGHALGIQYPMSPGPMSPGLEHTMSSNGGIPMSTVPLTPSARRAINLNSGYPELPARGNGGQFTTEFLPPPSKKAQKAEAKRRRHEKEDAVARRAGGWWRGRGCISDRGCYGRSGAEGRKRRRWYLALTIGFISMIILVVVLATTLHRKSNMDIGPSQWLNLTGFPPIFLGLSTVAAPVNVAANTGCVFPATQWSCDLPKELQTSVAPNQPNQPNFLLNIQWDNSSSTNATFANVTGNPRLGTRAVVGNPASAGQFVRSLLLKARQAVTFIPNPTPPTFAEDFFLGNTTDGIVSENKAGEPTPFYISFLSSPPSTTSKRLLRRDDPFPTVSTIIPSPSVNSDGTAAPANLLPFPTQQPIRLYDRGLPTEHYGFYTYFDRSIFLKSLALLNDTNAGDGEVPDDENGGATESEAAFRCTWAQTRFLVQMWTRMNGTTALLNSTSSKPGATNNATDFTQPGTFPYPITITTDRHGGDPTLKMIYCYDMNSREGIVSGSGAINAENRGFGGTVINPAPSVFSNSSDPALGGFDGGTGGCSCQWKNFQSAIPS
jgi:hypothetical protein